MRTILQKLAILGLSVFALHTTQVFAQATRTWISGVGDDANPCSRTAPCKTFAGAISKTAATGEINCLDSGGFGGVTITKAITLHCEGVTAGILVAATNGITINAGANDKITISGLHLEGLSTIGGSINGINILQAGSVIVRNTTIHGFGNGISFTPSNVAELFVTDSIIHYNSNFPGTVLPGVGILVQPTAAGAANVHINGVRLRNNVIGLLADGGGSSIGININVQNSMFSGNTSAGLSVVSPAGGAYVAAAVTSSQFSGNFGPALNASNAGSNSATIRVGSSMITANASAISFSGTGNVLSYGDNKVNGNGGVEAFSGAVAMK
jgi:hypothetical protein